MREIKFRAWDKEEKKMSETFELGGNNSVAYKDIEGVHMFGRDDLISGEFEIMQFTGLKDKNGKEIYEGDIVKWKVISDNGYKTDITDLNCEVRFDDGNYRFGASEDSFWHDLRDSNKELEIIGNIYENENLLPSPTPKVEVKK